MESDAGLTPYELRVKRNIEENQRVLKSLGLLNPVLERNERIKKTARRYNAVAKSRSTFGPNDESPVSPSLPARRTRRSSSILKSQGYDEFDDVPIAADEENTPPHKRRKIAPEPVFGPVEGVSVGDWWSTRLECSAANVHRPTVAGIHGKLGEGCYSIALSGGYEDDIDCGEYFTYTGSGGRDLKGTKTNPKNLRTAPQTKDQVLEGPNAALALNVENHRPVRVIRGYKLPSSYAPEEGYRYDGLYSVERRWTATGLSGFKVYKFALKRLPDQEPPPWEINGSIIPAQNGHGESREDGPLEDQNGSEDHIKTSDSANISTKCLKPPSKYSPNLVQNIGNDEVTVTENDNQKTPEGNGTSSEVRLNSEESREHLRSPDSLNSSQQVQEDENEALKQIQVSPDINNRLSNGNINPGETIIDSGSATDSLNSSHQVQGDECEALKQIQVSPDINNRLSNGNINPGETIKDSGSATDSLNSSQQVEGDECETLKQIQESPDINNRFSNGNINPGETIKDSGSATDSLNSSQQVQGDECETLEQIQVPPDINNKLSNGNINPEATIKDSGSAADSLNSKQNISESKVQTKQTKAVENVLRSPVKNCQVQLIPLSGIYLNGETVNLNSSRTGSSKRKSTGQSLHSTEKKVRFSPDVVCKFVEGNKCTVRNIPISSLGSGNQYSARKLDYSTKTSDSGELFYPQENDETGLQSYANNTSSESKKQTSLLRYFDLVKKADNKQVSSRGILLRSNRRSGVSNSFLPVSAAKSLQSDTVPQTNGPSTQASIKKSTQSKHHKALNAKGRCHSSDDKLTQIRESLSPGSSPVRACSVSLFRIDIDSPQKTDTVKAAFIDCGQLEGEFLGWDWSIDEEYFLGFDYCEATLFYGFEDDSEDMKYVLLMSTVIENKSEAI